MRIKVPRFYCYTKTPQRNTVTGSTSCQHWTMFSSHPIIPEQEERAYQDSVTRPFFQSDVE